MPIPIRIEFTTPLDWRSAIHAVVLTSKDVQNRQQDEYQQYARNLGRGACNDVGEGIAEDDGEHRNDHRDFQRLAVKPKVDTRGPAPLYAAVRAPLEVEGGQKISRRIAAAGLAHRAPEGGTRPFRIYRHEKRGAIRLELLVRGAAQPAGGRLYHTRRARQDPVQFFRELARGALRGEALEVARHGNQHGILRRPLAAPAAQHLQGMRDQLGHRRVVDTAVQYAGDRGKKRKHDEYQQRGHQNEGEQAPAVQRPDGIPRLFARQRAACLRRQVTILRATRSVAYWSSH